MNDSPLLNDFAEGITYLTLNQPKQYNSLSEEMLAALQQAIDSLTSDTRVLVIRANGKAFCAGHNLKQMYANPNQPYYDALFKQCSVFMQSLLTIPQPVIAQVQGLATAAGCQLVANCDLAIASENVKFAVSGINVGLFCSTPSVALSRNLSRKRAFEMLMTGDFINAHKAQEWGMLNQVVAEDELEIAVEQLAKKIIAKPEVAVRTGKNLFYKQLEQPLENAYAMAGDAMACNMMSDEAMEGVSAFIDKRDPTWLDKT